MKGCSFWNEIWIELKGKRDRHEEETRLSSGIGNIDQVSVNFRTHKKQGSLSRLQSEKKVKMQCTILSFLCFIHDWKKLLLHLKQKYGDFDNVPLNAKSEYYTKNCMTTRI